MENNVTLLFPVISTPSVTEMVLRSVGLVHVEEMFVWCFQIELQLAPSDTSGELANASDASRCYTCMTHVKWLIVNNRIPSIGSGVVFGVDSGNLMEIFTLQFLAINVFKIECQQMQNL